MSKLLIKSIINISYPISDWDQYDRTQKVSCICDSCKRTFNTTLRRVRELNKFICKACNIKETCIDKYGVSNPAKLKEVKEKEYKTRIERYGSLSASYQEGFEKTKKTFLEKYGSEYITTTEHFKTKAKETLIKHFGVDNPSKSSEVIFKREKTCLSKYGSTSYLASEEGRKRIEETCLKKYGCSNPGFLANAKGRKKYLYNDIMFDSSWELSLYIYWKDKYVPFQYHNGDYFEYEGDDGKIHRYYPDFKVFDAKDGWNYVEVKSDFLISENGNILDAVGNPNFGKTECMKQHNVSIYTSKELEIVFDYINKTYGKNYLLQFKLT